MSVHPLAGKPAPRDSLTDIDALRRGYFDQRPDADKASERVSFGTSGHRGTSLERSFNEAHILAITQAICDYRRTQDIDGPLYLGKDTHALSDPAQNSALAVLAANGVETIIQRDGGYTPTPVISRAILTHNRDPRARRADGIAITPSHNPPTDGGIKYNPPGGGPADTDVTGWIEERANRLLRGGNRDVQRLTANDEHTTPTVRAENLAAAYIDDLATVIDFEPIRNARLRIGVDPLGGAAVAYWKPIGERYGLNITLVNDRVDPAFAFMTLDYDGKIRMDCSSPYAMASLVNLKDRFDIAWGNDADVDRHGIVTRSQGLLNPNHYLAVAIHYLLTHRPAWSATAAVGKTLVSSTLIDRVVSGLGRKLLEVPVGFKWFAPGLLDGSLVFGGEESAGASFLRRDGAVWTTDKDGIILALLAAEITAVTGKDPGRYYQQLTREYGTPFYKRIDAPATPEQKTAFKRLTPERVSAVTLAGDPITARLTRAPGNNAPIGGIKIVTANGWFAARPSGTENIYKLYAESFQNAAHLDAIIREAQEIVAGALAER